MSIALQSKWKYDAPSSCSGVNWTLGALPLSALSLSVPELMLLPTASSRSDGVDEQEGIERVADRIETECLSFLNGRVTAFVPFLNVCLRDAALLEIIDDLVDPESADLAIAKSLNNVPLGIQSNL
jgi:hypothetical protein